MTDARATVLVTGPGGFIGSAVMRRLVCGERPLLWDGQPLDHVVALARPGGSLSRLEELPRDQTWSVERADLADDAALAALVRRLRPRAVLHLGLDRAAYRHVPEPGADALVRRPLEGLARGLAEVPGARLVHTGSAWVLAGGDRLDEHAPLRPRSPYAHNKACADELLIEFGDRFGVPWINLRLFNVFGRHEAPERLLPHLVGRLAWGMPAELSHGAQVRDFSDVDAMAEAYVLALAAPEEACGAVYHIGSGLGTSVRAFADEVAAALGAPELVRLGAEETADQDLVRLVADPALAARRLGWTPGADPRPAIRRAVGWWLRRWGPGEEARPATATREETPA